MMLRKFTNFVLSILSKYVYRVIGLVALLIIVGLFWSFAPYLLKIMIDTLASYSKDPQYVWSEAWIPVTLYLSAWVGAMLAFRGLDLIERSLYPPIRHDIMNAMFAYIIGHSHHYFQSNFSGSISNRILDMQNGVISILRKIDEAVFNLVFITGSLALLTYLHPIMALIFFTWMLVFSLISRYFFKRVIAISTEFSESKTKLVGHFVDLIANVSLMRLFSRQAFEKEQTDLLIYDTVVKDQKMRKTIIIMRSCWDLSMLTTMAVLLYTIITLYSQQLITVGGVAFVISTSMNIFHSLWHLTSQYAEFSEELGKCYQAMEILEAPHDITDTEDAIDLEEVKGDILFQNIHFKHLDGKALFKNKTVHIKPQEKIGLVGFSGSGKSSFINLLIRLFDVDQGHIFIDGHPIDQVTQRSLRENITLIPQDPSLFHRSIRDNIAYGKPDATDQEIIQAAKFAHCHEFIEILDEGYDTQVGERGIKLSGGQRQRIAIARAFLENAPILVLDEATSALDSVTETYIQESFHKLMQKKTTIVIAHRLSTLSQMDRLLVFDNGKIIEEGTHNDLIKADGHYAKMWNIQSTGAILSE